MTRRAFVLGTLGGLALSLIPKRTRIYGLMSEGSFDTPVSEQVAEMRKFVQFQQWAMGHSAEPTISIHNCVNTRWVQAEWRA